ncbi:DegT/DnrJ/EryC1/StrS family aminotransferase [Selenomonas ruminis]|uniref:DegT/DnrJ/EryC1/StrS family aminotransferase n=1 Tax=Selenomonas ruminis TaxID=2593411 RepID=A0A5D6WAW8_9FIRM|nr:DegT/DnrJ/EryC1/StrS family aminotransferase [Selenomonas sp. mPRGC5]TYZ24145.1 DegT/DnrJ/EryC1/StrS family aminotransferase [Selenomonas sp. mPRGC5]
MEKIGVGYAYVSDIEKKYVNEALDASRLSQGKMVHRFEKQFAELHSQKYGIACNSGTSALHVGLEALKEKYGVKEDSDAEVLVPAITFIATSNAVMHAGLKPVFVDVDPVTYNINPAEIEKKITAKTIGIIPVHTFGQPCDMDPIMEVAEKHHLWVMEDCAEAHFATYKGKKVGSFGEIAAFSTYVAHTITTGIGGVITTNDRQMMEISRSLIAHGRACTCEVCLASDPTKVCPLRMQTEMDKRFMMVRMGYSYRVGELEGALGLGQLENRDIIMGNRKKNARYLTEHLQDLQEYLQLPAAPDYVDHSYMMYPIVIRKGSSFKREELTHYLEKCNIETRPMLPLLNQPIYKELFGDIEDEYPVAKWIDHNGFYVGCHHGLSKAQLDVIIDSMHKFLAEK